MTVPLPTEINTALGPMRYSHGGWHLVLPDQCAIARIIDPEAMQKYEAGFDAPKAPTWDQISAFPAVKIAREKADKILSLIGRGVMVPSQTRSTEAG